MRDKAACRVLFVEDEAMVSMLIEDMLVDLGVEVVGPAARIDQALTLAREAEVEAAVLDINIGGHFTYPVADILQARGIPVIFATGYGAATLPERFRGTPTLQKPFDPQSFGEVVQAALAESPCDLSSG